MQTLTTLADTWVAFRASAELIEYPVVVGQLKHLDSPPYA
jgi:hypothetical protein